MPLNLDKTPTDPCIGGIDEVPGYFLRDIRRSYPELPVTLAAEAAAMKLRPMSLKKAFLPPLECPECGGHHFAQCDEWQPNGYFAPGPVFRCVECKLEINTKEVDASAVDMRNWNIFDDEDEQK